MKVVFEFLLFSLISVVCTLQVQLPSLEKNAYEIALYAHLSILPL